MPSRKVTAKAARLVADDAVREVPVRGFIVTGDTGHYIVTLPDGDGWATCSCPTVGYCSHVIAGRARRDGVSVEVVAEQLRAATERELARQAARRVPAVAA